MAGSASIPRREHTFPLLRRKAGKGVFSWTGTPPDLYSLTQRKNSNESSVIPRTYCGRRAGITI